MKSVSTIMLVLLVTVLAGCSEGPEATKVSGTVTYQGEPLPFGEIRFHPVEGTKARTAGGTIENGTYEVTNRGGVPAGTFRVEITGLRNADGSEGPVDRSDPGAVVEQYLPEKYNKNSDMTLTIEPDSGPMEKNFDLEG